MPSWNELLDEFNALSVEARGQFLVDRMNGALNDISRLRGDRNVILHGSAFLQKPQAPAQSLQITHEDMNGYMSVMFGMDWSLGLTLVLHTPGGVTNAAESLVAYIQSKFGYVETVVPTLAMSAGTMMALSSKVVVMGRQSQLGPIDPQMPVAGRFVSARAVVEQFDRALVDIKADLTTAHAWAPLLQTMGPALLQEAQNALDYGESMVARWLTASMFAGLPDAEARGAAVARHFNDATTHKSHGRRIDRAEAHGHGVATEELEASQDLQEAVLTAYHVMTIMFEQSPAAKLLWSNHGRTWLKNWVSQQPGIMPQQP
jgi:Serine dehydrogenase proteinase